MSLRDRHQSHPCTLCLAGLLEKDKDPDPPGPLARACSYATDTRLQLQMGKEPRSGCSPLGLSGKVLLVYCPSRQAGAVFLSYVAADSSLEFRDKHCVITAAEQHLPLFFPSYGKGRSSLLPQKLTFLQLPWVRPFLPLNAVAIRTLFSQFRLQL